MGMMKHLYTEVELAMDTSQDSATYHAGWQALYKEYGQRLVLQAADLIEREHKIRPLCPASIRQHGIN